VLLKLILVIKHKFYIKLIIKLSKIHKFL
jgi:hypothetical protein